MCGLSVRISHAVYTHTMKTNTRLKRKGDLISMEQTIKRNGWQEEESRRLWQAVSDAGQSGEPLRAVFERIGEETHRKPNSVRNYYYMQLHTADAPPVRRAQPFDTFTPEEVRALVRQVLIGRGRGESVRACVMRLSGGDQKKMLRLQNKYRSVMAKRHDLICEIADELAAEGIPCPAIDWEADAPMPALQPPHHDPDAQALYDAVERLLCRARESDPRGDRAKAQRDMCLMRLEEMQQAAGEMILICKELCAARTAPDADTLDRLTAGICRLENLCGSTGRAVPV